MPLGARLWRYAAELCSLSVTYLLCGLALTNTTDNLSEKCPDKLVYGHILIQRTLICAIAHKESYRGRIFPQWLS